MKHPKGLLYVTLFSLAWALNTTVNKYAFTQGADPIPFATHSIVIALLLSFIYVLANSREKLKKVTKRSFWMIMLAGLIGSGIARLLSFVGLDLSASINFGFLIKSATVFTVILAALFLNEKMSLKKASMILVLLIGAYLITTGGETIYPEIGDLIILAAAFCLAAANSIAKPLLKTNDPEIISLVRFLAGAIVLIIFSTTTTETALVIKQPGMVLLSAFFSFLTIYFINKTIQASSLSYMTMMSMMYSIFVTVFGYTILNESFNTVQIIGAGLIFVSVVFIHKKQALLH